MKALRLHGGARRDLHRAAGRYDEQVAGLGREFRRAFANAASLIAQVPDCGAPHKHGTRRLVLRRFPYSILYIERPDVLSILAVAHHRRREEYWLTRLASP